MIGTQNERALHAALKEYFEPDKSFHEQKYKRYIADIKKDDKIIEIQTRSFDRMRGKLQLFLGDGLDVTVVYPIAKQKWIIWVDPDTGEASKKRKSPKTGQVYDSFRELYKIKSFLTNPNLHIKLALSDMEEHRLLCGWSRDGKKGSERIERYPVGDFLVTDISDTSDFAKLIPPILDENFTVKDFMSAAKISYSSAGMALNVLLYTGAVIKVGKKGRAFLYSRSI